MKEIIVAIPKGESHEDILEALDFQHEEWAAFRDYIKMPLQNKRRRERGIFRKKKDSSPPDPQSLSLQKLEVQPNVLELKSQNLYRDFLVKRGFFASDSSLHFLTYGVPVTRLGRAVRDFRKAVFYLSMQGLVRNRTSIKNTIKGLQQSIGLMNKNIGELVAGQSWSPAIKKQFDVDHQTRNKYETELRSLELHTEPFVLIDVDSQSVAFLKNSQIPGGRVLVAAHDSFPFVEGKRRRFARVLQRALPAQDIDFVEIPKNGR